MNIHIGEIIEQKFQESGLKLPAFAERINTGERNVYSIFKRKDINAGMLKQISEVLEFNFFELYNPEGMKLEGGKKMAEQTMNINLNLLVGKSQIEKLPKFLQEISESGLKYGIRIL